MSYEFKFKDSALKVWHELDKSIQGQFKKKLIERLLEPRIESARLSGMLDCYKIKLRAAGYRLLYQVIDKEIVVVVVTVGKRERNQVYKTAVKRI